MNFYVQQAAPPILPAGQAGAPTNGFVQFLIIGGLLVGGYFAYEAVSAPAPRSAAKRPEPIEEEFAWTDADQKEYDRERPGRVRRLTSYLKKRFPGIRVKDLYPEESAVEAKGLVISRNDPDLKKFDEIHREVEKFGFGAKEMDHDRLFFEG